MKPHEIRVLLFMLVLFHTQLILGQERLVEVFHEEHEEGLTLYARNDHPFPITMEVEVDIENLEPNKTIPVSEVIAAKETIQVLTLTIKDPDKNWNYRSKYRYYMGDINVRHNDAFAYNLPYSSGESYRVIQGYGGNFSHQGELQYALDFQMEEGTPIHAARAGTVVSLEEGNDRGGPSETMMNYANYVTILHGDGTFADYSHLKKQGVSVELGDRVRTGQVIGYSGNTGYSTGPHLHFVVKKAKKGGGFTSIPVKFITSDGIQLLEAGESYREY